MPTATKETYFHKRIHGLYNATEADYSTVLGTDLDTDEPYLTPKPRPYFRETEAGGIVMTPFGLDRKIYTYTKDTKNLLYAPYEIERLAPEQVKDGKYKFPAGKGLGTFPWWPVAMVEAFEAQLQNDTFIITEGWLKAWYAARFGFNITGLSSITHYHDKAKQKQIHKDIALYLQITKPKRAIILYDADATNISLKDLKEGKDIKDRPNSFYRSALTIRELVLDYVKEIYFAQVKPGLEFEDNVGPMDSPKGLDDLLLCMPGKEADVLKDLTSFSVTPNYFTRINISTEPGRLTSHFHLRRPELFYDAHSTVIGYKEFVFNGTHYQFDDDAGELKVKIPGEAKNFAMVGDDYYEFVEVPDMYGHNQTQMMQRRIGTIKTWHGSQLIAHIPKYKAFCNVPNHVEFQPVLNGCYNKYAPFVHEPAEGDCSKTMAFMEHIFGDQLDMGLDYVQLLYQQPALPPNIFMPILCLVSRDQSTGKSTFNKMLKAIFTDNAVSLGNKDLQENFNAHYASKLVIMFEEAFVEKAAQIEEIKALCTSTRIALKDKFKSNQEIDFFGRIILNSNKVDNFIFADKFDTRYWVVEVPKIKTDNVNLLAEMGEEIPAFLHYLNNRKLSRPSPVSRFWFSFEDIQTDAFRRLVDQSRRYIDKDFEMMVREVFYDMPEHNRISMPIGTMAARIKALGKQYHNRDILEHLKREKAVEPKLQAAKNVLELAGDGIKYTVANKTARVVTFDRRDWLSLEEEAQLLAEQSKELTLADMKALLHATHTAKAVTSLFDDTYQVFVGNVQKWVKVQRATGDCLAWSVDRFNDVEIVQFV